MGSDLNATLEPLQIDDGYAIEPRRPGHGVEFDWRDLDRVKA